MFVWGGGDNALGSGRQFICLAQRDGVVGIPSFCVKCSVYAAYIHRGIYLYNSFVAWTRGTHVSMGNNIVITCASYRVIILRCFHKKAATTIVFPRENMRVRAFGKRGCALCRCVNLLVKSCIQVKPILTISTTRGGVCACSSACLGATVSQTKISGCVAGREW